MTQPADGQFRFREPVFKRTLASWVLFYERLGPALWQTVLVVGLFVAVAFFDVLPAMGGWWHLVALAAFLVAVVYFAKKGLSRLNMPTVNEARRRLEDDTGLAHRPLTTLLDRPASGEDGPTGALWRQHIARTLASIKNWRVGPPRVSLSKHDRFALRSCVLLVIGVSVAVGWGDLGNRFQRALSPAFAAGPPPVPPTLDMFITPPDYTRLPPRYLQTGGPQPVTAEGEPISDDDPPVVVETIAVPVGSTLLARVTGGEIAPNLTLGEGQSAEFDTVAERQFAI
ncbi:MAG: DUF4175 family protein, partial [Pseudomonadota bacterium]